MAHLFLGLLGLLGVVRGALEYHRVPQAPTVRSVMLVTGLQGDRGADTELLAFADEGVVMSSWEKCHHAVSEVPAIPLLASGHVVSMA
jgi:hypothetical protein